MSNQRDSEGFVTLVQGTADAVGRLLAGHLKLARLELMDGAATIGRRTGAVALFGVLATLGYALLVLGIAAWLQPRLGWAAVLLMFGLLHLLVGGVGTLLALRRLNALDLLPRTARGAAESAAALHPAGRVRLTLEEPHAA